MSQAIDGSRLKEIESAFHLFDKNADGKISKDELRTVFKEAKIPTNEEQVDQFFKMVDEDCNGFIDYEEFCKLTKIMVSFANDMEAQMKKVFDGIDLNNDEQISYVELKQALCKLGQDISDEEAKDIVVTFDKDNDGYINFCEFVTMMFMLEQCPMTDDE